jgi:hypothetical protein
MDMKIKNYAMLLAATVMFAGCKPSDQPNPDQQQVTLKDKAVETKDEFIAATDKKLHDLDAKIDDLSQRSAGLKDDAKVQADKALDHLRAERAEVGKKFDQLKESSQDGWEKTKAGFSVAWDDMQKTYYDTKAKFQ